MMTVSTGTEDVYTTHVHHPTCLALYTCCVYFLKFTMMMRQHSPESGMLNLTIRWALGLLLYLRLPQIISQ